MTAGDATVDSIDEIVANAFTRLTPEELLDLWMLIPPNYDISPAFDDSDGDGSVCNSGESLIDGKSFQLREIWLKITRYLQPAQE